MSNGLGPERVKQGLRWYREAWLYTYFRLPFHLAYLFGSFPTVISLMKPEEESWKVCGAAFTTFAVIASVSFGFARALAPDDLRRSDIVVAGELALHASIMALGTLLIVYGMARWPGFRLLDLWYFRTVLHLMIGSLASLAAFLGYRAVVTMDDVLSGRSRSTA